MVRQTSLEELNSMVCHTARSFALCYFFSIRERSYTSSTNKICNRSATSGECQVHSSCKPDKKVEVARSMLLPVVGLSLWIALNRRKLDQDKTAFI